MCRLFVYLLVLIVLLGSVHSTAKACMYCGEWVVVDPPVGVALTAADGGDEVLRVSYERLNRNISNTIPRLEVDPSSLAYLDNYRVGEDLEPTLYNLSMGDYEFLLVIPLFTVSNSLDVRKIAESLGYVGRNTKGDVERIRTYSPVAATTALDFYYAVADEYLAKLPRAKNQGLIFVLDSPRTKIEAAEKVFEAYADHFQQNKVPLISAKLVLLSEIPGNLQSQLEEAISSLQSQQLNPVIIVHSMVVADPVKEIVYASVARAGLETKTSVVMEDLISRDGFHQWIMSQVFETRWLTSYLTEID